MHFGFCFITHPSHPFYRTATVVEDTLPRNIGLWQRTSLADKECHTEFYNLDPELMQKALGVLVKRGKAQTFGQERQLGVKFF